MAYIVPTEMPNGCSKCPFSLCVFYNPFWVGYKPNTKGYCCSIDNNKTVLEMHIDEDLKAEWCPLKEVEVKELEGGNE